MTVVEVVEAVLEAGGVLVPAGDRIRYQIPERVASLVTELRRHKAEVLVLLKERNQRRAFAHLLPFLGKRVWTPLGPGKLVAVQDYVAVECEAGGRMRWYDSGQSSLTPRCHTSVDSCSPYIEGTREQETENVCQALINTGELLFPLPHQR